MEWQGWVTLAVLSGALGLLVGTRKAHDVVLVGSVTLLFAVGVLTPKEAMTGLANEGVWTIAALFAVAGGLRETGAMGWVARVLLGRPKSLLSAQVRIMVPTAIMSAFMNNTPLVAILLPIVSDWARRCRLAVSKLLLPLSISSILGGACTLIGTSTNLVVNGWLIEQGGSRGLGVFEITALGVPCAIAGILVVVVVGRWLLPERQPPLSLEDDPRSYTVDMTVEATGPLVGKTIEKAGLRHLPGVYLMEIEREEQAIPAVSPEEILRGNDRLVFVGVVDSVVDLHRIQGLLPAPDEVYKLDSPRSHRVLVEAVVSDSCPLVGMSVREGRFRTRYDAVIVAVARGAKRIRKKIGDITLRPGDTLLLEALPSFVTQQRNSRDFYLVSLVEDSTLPRHERAPMALAILTAMVLSVAFGWLSMLKASFLAAGLMILSRCCTAAAVRRSIDWQVLIVIAASLGLGKAIEVSGLAAVVGGNLAGAAAGSPLLALAIVYGVTMVLAAVVTSKAAAVLMLPLAFAAASDLGVSSMPFALGVLGAAATTVATPVGYPTNLMVYGPGGYRFGDYLRIGAPISLVVAVISLCLIPRLWPF